MLHNSKCALLAGLKLSHAAQLSDLHESDWRLICINLIVVIVQRSCRKLDVRSEAYLHNISWITN